MTTCNNDVTQMIYSTLKMTLGVSRRWCVHTNTAPQVVSRKGSDFDQGLWSGRVQTSKIISMVHGRSGWGWQAENSLTKSIMVTNKLMAYSLYDNSLTCIEDYTKMQYLTDDETDLAVNQGTFLNLHQVGELWYTCLHIINIVLICTHTSDI